MKRNRMLLAGLFTFALVCVSLTFVGSTYAKYTSEVTGTDTIRAAKYEWTFDGEDEEDLVGSELDLAFASTPDFSDVVIAPDFKFANEFIIKNEGETTLVFTLSQLFDFTATGVASGATNPVLLSAQLKSGSNEPVTAYAAKDDEITTLAEFSTFELAPGASYTLIITFDWPAEPTHGNANDTLIGRDTTSTWTYKLKVLAVQKVNSDAVIE